MRSWDLTIGRTELGMSLVGRKVVAGIQRRLAGGGAVWVTVQWFDDSLVLEISIEKGSG